MRSPAANGSLGNETETIRVGGGAEIKGMAHEIAHTITANATTARLIIWHRNRNVNMSRFGHTDKLIERKSYEIRLTARISFLD